MAADIFAVIVAGGSGKRMGVREKKQYLSLDGIPILTHTVKVFASVPSITKIILVLPKEDLPSRLPDILAEPELRKVIHVTAGGRDRQDSVKNGLTAITTNFVSHRRALVLIHDGVRPFIQTELVERCIRGAAEHGACIPALPIVDTLKQVGPDDTITATLSRDRLYRAQTPQAFDLNLILKAFDHAETTSFSGTDDASLIEHLGEKVVVIPGSEYNIKITRPEDLLLARAIHAIAT